MSLPVLVHRLILGLGLLAALPWAHAASFVVTDTIDDAIPTSGTLRWAIQQANATPGLDTISFNIPGTGTHTITLQSALPDITDPVDLDATTDDSFAANGNQPAVVIDGNSLATAGITITNTAGGTSIRGLVITHFQSSAVWIQSGSNGNTVAGNYLGQLKPDGTQGSTPNGGSGVNVFGANNVIGGTTSADRNVIAGNANGVLVQTATASGNLIVGNYIGTDATGNTAVGNTFDGVRIQGGATGNVIGGATPAHRNVISGNGSDGVQVDGEGTSGNTVAGNWIGVNAAGTAALGNAQDGIFIATGPDNSVVGGSTPAEGNWIAATGYVGVEIDGETTGTLIQFNRIGTDLAGTANWGTQENGILIENSGTGAGPSNNLVADNIVAFGGQGGAFPTGVRIRSTAGAGNALLRNSIYNSASLGIDLGTFDVTPNDAGDADTGPNNLQNFPVLTSALGTGSQLLITGTLNSTANDYFHIEFFANPSANASGHGEGKIYLGAVNTQTNGSGNTTFNASFAFDVANPVISATATKSDATYSTFTDTSEFAATLTVTNTAPSFSLLNGTPTFVEDGSAVVLDSDVSVSDAQLSAGDDFNGASLTLARNGGANAQDLYSASGLLGALIEGGALIYNGTTIGSVLTNSGGTLVLSFNGNATDALVDATLRAIAYANSNHTPPASVQINWTFNDGNTGGQGVGGALSATGSTTVSITPVNDPPTGTVSIGGTPTQAQTLTASNTLADLDGLGTITYTWKANGTTVGTGSTLLLTQAQVGTTITVTASYTDGYGTNEAVTSAGVGPVANVNDAPTGTVSISGTPTQGQTLTATNTLADADGLGTITYTWKANGTTVSTGTTLLLTQAQVGTIITVTASYTDSQGTNEGVTSSGVGPVANLNDAPILTPQSPVLPPLTEDDIANAGLTVAALLAGAVNDIDTGSTPGIAVTATDNGNGWWQYSLDGGVVWVAIGTVADNNALLLRDTDRVRFLPSGENGTLASLSYRAWDQSAEVAGTKVDTTINGGITPFSSATDTASIAVTSVNDAPRLAHLAFSLGSTGTTLISGTPTIAMALAAAGWSDVDIGAVGGVALIGIGGAGTAQYSSDGGLTWANCGAVADNHALLLDTNTLIRYVPAGVVEVASFTARAWDLTTGVASTNALPSYADTTVNGGTTAFSPEAATATCDVVVTPNVSPTLVLGYLATLPATNEDTASAPTSVASLLTGAGYADLDLAALRGLAVLSTTGRGTWQYSTDGMTWTAFGAVAQTAALLLTDTSQIRYLPDMKNGETATLTFVAWDRTTGTASTFGTPAYGNAVIRGAGTPYSVVTADASITVTSVNDPPTVLAPLANQTGIVGTMMSFTVPAGNFGDVDVGDTLTYSALAVPPWLTFNAATLTFSGTPTAAGSTTITARATDSAGAYTQSPFQIVVAMTNRPPVITSNGGGATAAITVTAPASVVTTVTASDPDLPAQTLSFAIAGGADAARFHIDAVTGILRFAAAIAPGTYAVIVAVSDGTLSASQTLSVTVVAPPAIGIPIWSGTAPYGLIIAILLVAWRYRYPVPSR